MSKPSRDSNRLLVLGLGLQRSSYNPLKPEPQTIKPPALAKPSSVHRGPSAKEGPSQVHPHKLHNKHYSDSGLGSKVKGYLQ